MSHERMSNPAASAVNQTRERVWLAPILIE